MKSGKKTEPTVLIIFGGTGDLTKRKLIPAFYNLYLDKWLGDQFAVIGMGRTSYSDEQYRERLKEGIGEFSRRGRPEDGQWASFAQSITYLQSEIANAEAYTQLAERLNALDQA